VTDPRLDRAKARLDRLDWYPRPVRVERVRIVTAPWLFLVRSSGAPDDLIVHELCHVWQMQHRLVRMPLSYLRTGYRENPYERQARAAVELTRP
jgi:hypothetical protein